MQSNGLSENKLFQETDHTLSRLASIGQMAAGIAHEVRNPLTSVKGFLQLLQKESPHSYLDVACSELERAISTLQNLLEVSKPDLDDEPYVPIHLCSELEAILYLFQDQLYKIRIEKKFENTDEVIYGKRNQLKKAFFNILKNAFEAINEEGTITIEHYRRGRSVHVSICDTGIGIPESKLPLLGTPFFSTKDDGTGMGLAQVFSTIYQHGATIHVNSREGEGTTFMIEFPTEQKEENGVVKLNLEYKKGQDFKEFINLNEGRLNELLAAQAKMAYQENDDEQYRKDLYITCDKIFNFIMDHREHELILLAKERGKIGAKNNIPLIVILDAHQAFRKVYWDLLYNYYQYAELELDKEEFFEMERRVNSGFDTFLAHYFSSYIAYKDEILRSQREIIDDLTVPVIPLSSSMAVLPIVGTMDTYRAKRIQERALNRIASLRTEKIIIDLSGVAFMDTAVVGHLFRIVEGINLLGCHAIVTGIRPEIANTMIEMGISLTGKVETKGTLQQALEELGLR